MRDSAGVRLVLKTLTVSSLLRGESVALARETDRIPVGRIHLHAGHGYVTFANLNEIINAFGRERVRVHLAHWLSRMMTVIMQRGAPPGAYEIEEEHCFAPNSYAEYGWEFGETPETKYEPC